MSPPVLKIFSGGTKSPGQTDTFVSTWLGVGTFVPDIPTNPRGHLSLVKVEHLGIDLLFSYGSSGHQWSSAALERLPEEVSK